MNALRLMAVTAALALTAAVAPAVADDWPSRPVTVIVAAGAGGGTDATARWLAADLEQKFGKPFNVVNRADGGGIPALPNSRMPSRTATPSAFCSTTPHTSCWAWAT